MKKKLPAVPIGAVELIQECRELLAGQRREFTPVADYTAQRRRYWQMQGNRLPHRPRAALPRGRVA